MARKHADSQEHLPGHGANAGASLNRQAAEELDHLAFVIHDLRGLDRSGALHTMTGSDLLDQYLVRRDRVAASIAEALPTTAPAKATMPPPPATQTAARPPQVAPQPITARAPVEPAVVLLWLGAFLVTIASLIFVAYNWSVMSGPVKTALMAGLSAGFLAAGLVSRRRASLIPASATFYAIGAVLTPLTFAAAYNFWLSDGAMDWRTLGVFASVVSGVLYARMAVAGMVKAYAWAAVAAGAFAIAFALLLTNRWSGLWPAALVLLAYAVLTQAPRVRREPWEVFRQPLLALAIGSGIVASLAIGVLTFAALAPFFASAELARHAAIDLAVAASVLALAATRRRQTPLAVAAVIVATVAVLPAIYGFPLGQVVIATFGGVAPAVRVALFLAATLALGGSLLRSDTWRQALRGCAVTVALVAPWIGVLDDSRALTGRVWPAAPIAMTVGLALVWLATLAWRRTRPGWVVAAAVGSVAGFGLIATMAGPYLLGWPQSTTYAWLGLAFTWIAAVALALGADDEPWLDAPALGLLVLGALVTPWPWTATTLSFAAVGLWLIADNRLPLGARAHRPQAVVPASVAAFAALALGFVVVVTAWSRADWYPVALTLFGLTVVGLLVVDRFQRPGLAGAPLLTGTLAVVTAIVAQPISTPWIVHAGGFWSAVGIAIVGLSVGALLLIARARPHWRRPLWVYAVMGGTVAPSLVVPTLLPAVAAVGLATAWAAVATWRGHRPRWLWFASVVALAGFVGLASALAPDGMLAMAVGSTGTAWTMVAGAWLLAAGVATLSVLDRRPVVLYPALGLFGLGLAIAVSMTGVVWEVAVGWMSGSGAALALAAFLVSRRWRALSRPPAEGGALLAVVGVGLSLAGRRSIVTDAPLSLALFLVMTTLFLDAAALRLRWLAEVASAAGIAWLLHLWLVQQRSEPQWYALTIGLWLAALAIERGRRGDLPVANALVAASAIAMIGPSLVQSLTYTDAGWRYFLLGLAESFAFLVVGLRWRLRAPTVAGAIGLGLIAGYQVFDGIRSLPNWAILGLAGSVMLAVAVALLLLRERVTRAGADVRQQWRAWR